MSTTTTTTSPSSSAIGKCSGPSLYELPIKDASVGTPNDGSYKSTFQSCAAPAKVQTYHDDCALYAPALDQTIQELVDCLYDNDVKWEDVWYTGALNASATGKDYPTASATPTKKDDGEDAKETGSEKGGDDDDTNSAAGSRAPGLLAWGVFGLLVSGLFGGLA